MKHADYMSLALEEAQKALEEGEIPVGCIIVKDGAVLSSGRNTSESAQTALGHAEINAIAEACSKLKSRRLSGCTLYVTLEPCMMCLGAILNARIDQVVFGASDSKSGICGQMPPPKWHGCNHSVELLAGISEEACQAILTKFFGAIR